MSILKDASDAAVRIAGSPWRLVGRPTSQLIAAQTRDIGQDLGQGLSPFIGVLRQLSDATVGSVLDANLTFDGRFATSWPKETNFNVTAGSGGWSITPPQIPRVAPASAAASMPASFAATLTEHRDGMRRVWQTMQFLADSLANGHHTSPQDALVLDVQFRPLYPFFSLERKQPSFRITCSINGTVQQDMFYCCDATEHEIALRRREGAFQLAMAAFGQQPTAAAAVQMGLTPPETAWKLRRMGLISGDLPPGVMTIAIEAELLSPLEHSQQLGCFDISIVRRTAYSEQSVVSASLWLPLVNSAWKRTFTVKHYVDATVARFPDSSPQQRSTNDLEKLVQVCLANAGADALSAQYGPGIDGLASAGLAALQQANRVAMNLRDIEIQATELCMEPAIDWRGRLSARIVAGPRLGQRGRLTVDVDDAGACFKDRLLECSAFGADVREGAAVPFADQVSVVVPLGKQGTRKHRGQEARLSVVCESDEATSELVYGWGSVMASVAGRTATAGTPSTLTWRSLDLFTG